MIPLAPQGVVIFNKSKRTLMIEFRDQPPKLDPSTMLRMRPKETENAKKAVVADLSLDMRSSRKSSQKSSRHGHGYKP